MKTAFKILGYSLLGLLSAGLLVPLLLPLPPAGEFDARGLAGPASQFVPLNGLDVHVQEAGSGEPAYILLHGFGASTYSWREVIAPLAQNARVIAYDRPAFGLTSRPMPGEWNGASPYALDAQAELLIALMDARHVSRAILVGNSAGGTVAVYTALKYPQRVQALILVDAAIYTNGGLPDWARPLLASPWGRWYGPLFARQIQTQGMNMLINAWHDPARLTPEIIANYRAPLQVRNWDRALFELTLAQAPANLAARLGELKMPVLVVTGDDDRIVPTAQSLRLAQDIPGSRLHVFANSGHVPQEETPLEFLSVVQSFVKEIQ